MYSCTMNPSSSIIFTLLIIYLSECLCLSKVKVLVGQSCLTLCHPRLKYSSFLTMAIVMTSCLVYQNLFSHAFLLWHFHCSQHHLFQSTFPMLLIFFLRKLPLLFHLLGSSSILPTCLVNLYTSFRYKLNIGSF